MQRDTCPAYVITLVHGTFARRANWSRPESNFAKALQARINNTVRFESFDWSGFNLHRARLLASRRLADKLISTRKRFPGAKLIVVGHSHGGNVAAYALRDPIVAAAVDGLVSLATPFIWVTEGNATAWIIYFAQAAIVEAFVLAFVIVAIPLIAYIESRTPHLLRSGDFNQLRIGLQVGSLLYFLCFPSCI